LIFFTKLKLKNFRSFGNAYSEFIFKEGFDLLSASNASGKTSLIQSLTYCLFGRVPKIKINELINNINNSDMCVEVEFQKKKDYYKIVRGEKPKVFEIYKNNELLDQKSKALDYQDMLEKEILGINVVTFGLLVSLDTTLLNKSFITMQEFERRQFLETILDIRILFYINQIISARLSIFKTQKVELEYKIKVRKEMIDSERKKLEDIIRINKDIVANGNAMVIEREQKVQYFQERIIKYNTAFEEISNKKTEYNNINEEKNILNQKVDEHKRLYKEVDKKILAIDAARKTSLRCSSCGTINSGIDISDDTYNSFVSEKTAIHNILQQYRENQSVIETKLEKILRVINDESRLKANFVTTNQDFESALRELEKAKNFKLLPENTEELERLETEYSIFQGEYTDLLKTEENLNKLKRLVSDDGIKKKIFEKYIPIFNQYLNEILLEFNLNYNIIFNDKFEITILDRGEERSYYTFSASEKLRVNLVIMFSFLRLIEKRNSFSMNILIVDELLDNALSAEVQDLVLKFLKYKVNSKDKLIVSHNSGINVELFDRIFSKNKEKSFSNLYQKE